MRLGRYHSGCMGTVQAGFESVLLGNTACKAALSARNVERSRKAVYADCARLPAARVRWAQGLRTDLTEITIHSDGLTGRRLETQHLGGLGHADALLLDRGGEFGG